MQKFFLKSFKLKGHRKDYEIKFRKGLNFISGPTSTGKTTILELIDYALGAKDHKAYIEVGENCSEVEIEVIIDSIQFRIRRKLFSFNLPIAVEIFNDNKYFNYGVYSVDSKDNKELFTDFLLSKLHLDGIMVSNQKFSFRDLFKYSYLKQTEIDNENIYFANGNFALNIKRKATFEIIFNIYDDLLSIFKKEIKEKVDSLKKDQTRFDGVKDFLKIAEIDDNLQIETKKVFLKNEIKLLNQRLLKIKELSCNGKDSSMINEYNNLIRTKRNVLSSRYKERDDLNQYIAKLRILSNQYEQDVDKINAAMIGIKEINKFSFMVWQHFFRQIY